MNITLQNILINKLRVVPVGKGVVTPKKKLTFLAELASLGYTVDNPELYNDSVLDNHDAIISTLKGMRGGDVAYVPLFQGFPDDCPEDNEYFIKRIIGYLGNFIGLFEDGRKLDNGFYVPEWLFDLEEFGADPITQFQDKGLFDKGVENQNKRASDTHIEWVTLQLIKADEVNDCAVSYLQNVIYAKSSISEHLKADIVFLLGHFDADCIDASQVVFKETSTYLMKYFWIKNDLGNVGKFIRTSTDVLRLFAALTDSDVSLAEKIKFPKINRKQRRFVLECLNNMNSAVEDMNQYKGLWLEVGRFLHPGEYSLRYPKTYAAFDTLRNGKVETFNGKVEAAVVSCDITALVELLSQKPGIFGRKIHQVLAIAKTPENIKKVLDAFAPVVDKVELKNLLVMESYFKTIEDSDWKTIINKKGRIRVMKNTKHRVAEKDIVSLLSIIQEAIIRKVAADKETWTDKNVWVDPVLEKYSIPLQQRKASDGLLTLGRGSRIPLDIGKVLRLFVYWKETQERTDYDLSLIMYDEYMEYKNHISYTCLDGAGMQHSGDIQSAPQGAAEFIDVDLTQVKKNKNVRYLASQIFVYSGENFMDCTCHAGWMIRDKVSKSYKSFDIKTVQNKFDLNGLGSYAIPVLVDLQENEVIFVDLYVGAVNSRFRRVEGATNDISVISREVARMNETRPNMFSLATYNVKGRHGTFVEDVEKADITIGVNGCDYNVGEVEKVLTEFI
jgi:hypothetical protein